MQRIQITTWKRYKYKTYSINLLLTSILYILVSPRILLEAKLSCQNPPAKIPLKLQGTFVIDRSYQFLADSSGYIIEIKYLLLDLVEELEQTFQETDFALTSFSNYLDLPGTGESNKEDSCYKLHVSFNSNGGDHLEEIEEYLKAGKSWTTVSALTAVAHSSADQELNWESTTDKTTMKVIFLITDKESNEPGNFKGFHSIHGAIRGDGKDVSCNHKMPTDRVVGDIATKNKMYIVGFFHLDSLSNWKNRLERLLPKKTLSLSFLDDFSFVTNDVVEKLRTFACKDFAYEFNPRSKKPVRPPLKIPVTIRTTTTKRPTQRPFGKPYNTLGPRFLPI
ncbi:unnamed protein product [Orchesella dallaii]|uniref:VWFA domain-containing protein n=1 Tax=Orchesella dallaii TaxID=48710 RepID=A0ABP1PWF3_9HEXA